MFDEQLPKNQYDGFNSLIRKRNAAFYISMSGLHTVGFMYLSYFFRMRRLTLLPCVAVAAGYSVFFSISNNIAYRLIVDKPVIDQARRWGLERHVQPVGQFKNRGLNYA